MAGTACGTDHTNDGKDDVLGGDSGLQLAAHCHTHVLGLLLHKGLGGQHVLHLGGTNTKGQGSESTVGGSVGVTAHNHGAGQGEALLGSNDVNNALALVIHGEVCQVEVLHVLLQGQNLSPALSLLDEGLNTLEAAPVSCGHVVVHGNQSAVWAANRASSCAQALESLRTGHLVHQMTIDVNDASIAVVVDQMRIPNLVIHGLASLSCN
mmetsp:Transcript_32816/g.72496  ORF Transcript_32816/g.72496 Transcript_32816/m.72496 type:complete len:209 (-) Transcript_32816:194-820(-)